MFKPGISANAAHILFSIEHADPDVRIAICEQILSFADLEGQPACIGFKEAFAGEDRAAQISAASAMASNGILEQNDLKYFRERALESIEMRCLTDLEMKEVKAMLACAARRIEKLHELARQQPGAVFRSDMRLALADVITPFNSALETLE